VTFGDRIVGMKAFGVDDSDVKLADTR